MSYRALKTFEGSPEVRVGLGPTMFCTQRIGKIIKQVCNLPMKSALKRDKSWKYYRVYRCPLGHETQAHDEIKDSHTVPHFSR